jgi:terpene synthase-like protein
MEQIVIPDIYCPFPSLISSHLEQVREHTLDWIERFRLIQGEAGLSYYRAIDIPEAICRIYPKASLEELLVLNDYYIWGFIYDDLYDDEKFSTQPEGMDGLYEHMLAILQTPSLVTPQGSLAEATVEAFQRMKRFMTQSPVLQKRFIQAHIDWLAAEREDAVRHTEQQIVDVQTCLDSRMKSAAALAAMAIIEIVEHMEIPDEIYEGQPFQNILVTAAHILTSANDVYSLQKELSLDDVNNVVIAMQRTHSCSLQEAMDQTCAMIETKIRRFQELSENFPASSPENDRDIRTFLVDLGIMIRGALDWYRSTTRYKGLAYPGIGKLGVSLKELLPPV